MKHLPVPAARSSAGNSWQGCHTVNDYPMMRFLKHSFLWLQGLEFHVAMMRSQGDILIIKILLFRDHGHWNRPNDKLLPFCRVRYLCIFDYICSSLESIRLHPKTYIDHIHDPPIQHSHTFKRTWADLPTCCQSLTSFNRILARHPPSRASPRSPGPPLPPPPPAVNIKE